MKRTILLLGGSRQQLIAISKAKELGYRTVLCDYLPDNPGQHIADVFYRESTTDREAILRIAKREKVSGIIAYSSDPASPTAGYVARQLGLPSNPLESIEIMSEKHLFRSFLKDNGFPCPGMTDFSIEEPLGSIGRKIEKLSYPIVVKPTDSSGSKGVAVVACREELEGAIRAAAEYSRNGILIAEEYIQRSHPAVIGGDVFVVGGCICFWGLMECLRDANLGGLVPVGKTLPPNIDMETLNKVKEVLQRLVSALNIRFGELNVEIIIGGDRVPYVLELGSRAGGNMIPVQLSDASGIDLVAANIQCAMGEDPGDIHWDSFESDKYLATYVLHSDSDGLFGGVYKSEWAKNAVYREVLYQEENEQIERFDGANKALGIEFIRFESKEKMEQIIPTISKEVCPRVR